MSETTIDPETGEILEGDEPDDAQEEAEREAEQEAELKNEPKREASQVQLQKADSANRTYMRKLASILGEDENRHECTACNGLGVTWGDPTPATDLQHPSEYVACERCAGYGVVESGSKHPDYAVVVCTDCSGKGYSIAATQQAPIYQVPPLEPPAAQVLQGQYVPGRGFIPYGSDEPLPGSLGA
jgi:DnaJ-class molecular chaperone